MVVQELSVCALGVPGDPDTLQSQPCRSLSLGSTGIFIKITVYFVPSGSDFNLSVL